MTRLAIAITVAVIALGVIAIPCSASVTPVPPSPTPLPPDPHPVFDPDNPKDGVWYWVDNPASVRMNERFDTIAGHEYRLSFSFSIATSTSDPSEGRLAVIVDGTAALEAPLPRLSASVDNGDVPLIPWVAESLDFSAASSKAFASFQAFGDISLPPMMCGVCVSDITAPEPATVIVWSLLGLASWLAVTVRRFKH